MAGAWVFMRVSYADKTTSSRFSLTFDAKTTAGDAIGEPPKMFANLSNPKISLHPIRNCPAIPPDTILVFRGSRRELIVLIIIGEIEVLVQILKQRLRRGLNGANIDEKELDSPDYPAESGNDGENQSPPLPKTIPDSRNRKGPGNQRRVLQAINPGFEIAYHIQIWNLHSSRFKTLDFNGVFLCINIQNKKKWF
nr:hypothetical protein Iba_chr08bCG6060 [Ipomoea batatas]